MTPEGAMDALRALGDPGRAAQAAAYHKVPRTYLGVPVPAIDDLARDWRQALPVDARVALARALWASDVHEARVAAAKLFLQARIRPDEAVWAAICDFVPDFDGWALADHMCIAGQKRLIADPRRIDTVAGWVTRDRMWTRRAALVITLPWTKQNHPDAQDLAIRDRVLGWAAGMATDRDWSIQKAVAWWLRDLSRHDPDRTRAFLAGPGQALKPWARAEAARHLTDAQS